MTYQIECGHCRKVVTLVDGDIGRTLPCPECGGMIAVVSPVPTIPVAAEEFDFPALNPNQPMGSLPVETRVLHIQQPWPLVRRGLFVTLVALHVGIVVYILFLFAVLVVGHISEGKVAPLVRRVVSFLVVAQLAPILFHAVGQLYCMTVPRASGSRLVRASVLLQLCSALALTAFPVVGFYAVIGSVVLMLASYGAWLTFLSRMGRSLNDQLLVRHSWSFASWYWSGLAIVGALFVGAMMARQAGGRDVAWLCHAAAGAVGLMLLYIYYSLLLTALRGIARHAPV